MAIDDGSHRAHCEEGPDGQWSGGCKTCGVHFGGAQQLGAESWCAGHNSAVVCADRVAASTPATFPKVGPGGAATLRDLRALLDAAVERFGGDQVEIIQPFAEPPFLYLWTRPTEEGWHRERLGAFHLEHRGQFVPEPNADAQAGAPLCESCKSPRAAARSTDRLDPWWLCDDCSAAWDQAGVEDD